MTSAARVAAALAALVASLSTGAALAEPRFAVREGMPCSHCHVNRTGGGMRTPFGVAWSQTHAPTWRLPGVVEPRVGYTLAFGANVRLNNRTVFPSHTQIADQQYDSPASNSFGMTEANIYIRSDLVEEYLTLYVDETIAPEGAANREAFVLLHGLPLDGYVKAGRFLLPHGLRLLDDAAFIRQETGFTYANQDLGIELGISPGPLSLSVAITNGTAGGFDDNLVKQVSTWFEGIWDWGRAGASFAWNDGSGGEFTAHTFTTGIHGGVRAGRLMLLGEFDWIRGVTDGETYDQWALYTGVDFEAYKGLWVHFAFEAFDPLMGMANNERDRFVFGLSWFPIQFLEIKAEYRLNRDIPQRIQGNPDELIFEIHGFL